MKILLSTLLYSVLSLTSFALSLAPINDSIIRPIDTNLNVIYKDPKTGIISCGVPPIPGPRIFADPNHGLIAWYPLDGNASDMSGNSRHGTIYGSNPTEDRHGKMNGAYNFDGIDDYIKINHDKAFNHLPLSISAWFNTKGNSGQAGIISKYWAAHWNGWQIMDFNGDLVPWYLSSCIHSNVIIG